MNLEEINKWLNEMNEQEVLGAFLLVNNPIVLSEEETKDVQKAIKQLQQENQQLKDKLSKIETLIINHNCDTGDIYYKYNSKFVKSELKQRILEIVYEERSDE